MAKPPIAAIVIPMDVLREIKMNADAVMADRVKIDIDAKGDVSEVWWHEADDVAWRRLRGRWTK